MQITWIENNGSFLAYQGQEYCGMASQSPTHPRVKNPGKWSATWNTEEGGIESRGWYNAPEEAKREVEKQLVDRNFLSELKAGILEAITSEDGLDGGKHE